MKKAAHTKSKSLWLFSVGLLGVFFIISPSAMAAPVVPSSQTTISATTTLLFLGNKNIAPVMYLDGTAPAGVAVDIVRALAKHLPQPVEVRAMDWPTAQTLVAEGKADALIQINQTEERKKIYDFSDPLLESHFSIFTNTNRVGISGVDALEGLRVGVEAGGLPQQLLSLDSQINLVVIPGFLEGFQELNAGSIDAVVVDYRVGSYVVAQNKLQAIKVTGDPIAPSYSAFAVKKGNTKLLNEINEALRSIKADGTYQVILNNWRPTEVIFQTQQQITNEIFYATIFALLVLLFIAVMWMVTIRRELSRRKRAEAAEQKAEKYTENFISSANAMIVGLDLSGKVTLFNEAAEKISGYRKDEVIGRNWFELIVPRARFPKVWEMFEESQKQGKPIMGDFENPILTKSGEERIIEWRNSNVHDDGKIIGTISFGIDITDRKVAEEALHEERQLFVGGPTVIFKWRAAEGWPVEYVSPNVESQFGYTPTEITDEKFRYATLVHPEDIDRVGDEVSEYGKQALSSFEQTYRVRHKDGQYRWVSDFTTVGRDEHGVITHYLGYVSDITERKETEKEMLERTKELALKTEEARDSEKAALNIAADLKDEEERLAEEKTKAEALANDLKKFKLALDNASDQVTITDAEGIVIYANPAVERVAGYEPEEVVGKKAGELWKLPMPAEYYQQLWHTIRDQKLPFIGEIQNRRKNGEIYTALFNVSPVLDIEGNILFYVSLERDITKEKEIDKAKSEFISLASHQMRTPLTAINWYTEMLLNGDAGKLNEKQEEYFKAVYDGGQKMNEIIKSFLHILRLESGTVVANPVSINLTELIRLTLKETQLDINRKKLRVIEQYQDPLPFAMVDPEIMRVVLQNLISNAAKYTPQEGEITLSLGSIEKGGTVAGKIAFEDSLLVSVKDTGIGIPQNDHSKISTKFFRAENAKKWDPNGNGIGLYMANKMVDFLGGMIWFESEEGKGAVFYVLIPVERKKS